MKLLVLNGVNLNMLGRRDPKYYGNITLAELEQVVANYAADFGLTAECRQSNCEGELVNILQQTDAEGVIFNAGAYSHYSYALRDCIECLGLPVVEVHLSDVSLREEFRHVDVLADVCAARFMGKGVQSYLDAVNYFVKANLQK